MVFMLGLFVFAIETHCKPVSSECLNSTWSSYFLTVDNAKTTPTTRAIGAVKSPKYAGQTVQTTLATIRLIVTILIADPS